MISLGYDGQLHHWEGQPWQEPYGRAALCGQGVATTINRLDEIANSRRCCDECVRILRSRRRAAVANQAEYSDRAHAAVDWGAEGDER